MPAGSKVEDIQFAVHNAVGLNLLLFLRGPLTSVLKYMYGVDEHG